jgi:DNA repair exonuclease SbcCD ATPase subunit
MFKIKSLSVKNFMSVGNVTQSVNFDRNDLTLVLGQNMDLGGDDAGARNGTGKTTMINALSYGLYGLALTNIKKDNLVNKTNSKAMVVTVDFQINNNLYRIERGRKPTFLKFYANGIAQKEDAQNEDDSQGDSRETQKEIELLLGMSHDMFKHVLALNTYTEPFLSMRANDQREIIEQLLGITQLSAKAEKLKELVKKTKDSITEEEYRIKAIQDANKKIQEQIESLERRQRLWETKREEDINNLVQALEDLKDIDIEKEIKNHKLLADYHTKVKRKQEADKWLKSLRNDYAKEEKIYEKLNKEIVDLQDHKCFACGSKLHDSKQESILEGKLKQKDDSEKHMLKLQSQADEYETILTELGDIGKAPKVFYDTIEQAMEHRNSIDKLSSQLEHRLAEQDPYIEQIADMRISAVEEISWDHINELTKFKEHQEFLFKLLTNKDSFIRKTIIDQNLAYLNARLQYYLQQIGLPHSVKFQSDLTVLIEELGRELDFDNLSRGERNRLILSLSWAFRDVWEGLYQPINLLFIDEMVDSGMDTSGVEAAIAVLKKMSRERNKSIFLVSHKDELSSRVNNILTVIKENGFTMYSNDIEIKEV